MTDHCHHRRCTSRCPVLLSFQCALRDGHTGPHQAFPGNTRGHTWANDNDQEAT